MKLFLKCLLFGVLVSFSMQIPFIGLLVFLPALPVAFFLPELGTTGQHVEIGFAWIILKSWLAWAAYIFYYTMLSFIIVKSFKLLRKTKTK